MNMGSIITQSIISIMTLLLAACTAGKHSGHEPEKGTYAYDLEFLQKIDKPVILKNQSGSAQVIVSPEYQGKVFTSTARGPEGKSFGWINYELLESDSIAGHINAHGGENRLWIGPEGGRFSVFFKPEGPMTFDNWFTPAPIDTEPWELVSSTAREVIMIKDMELSNYSGTGFKLKIHREVKILEQKDVEVMLGVSLNEEVDFVGYQTLNKMTNSGANEWTRETGTLCIWMLDMFAPGEKVTVVVPFIDGPETELGPIATTNYFGEIPPDRIRIAEKILFLKVDGKKRSKIGIGPYRAKPVSGSYDEDHKVLTIAYYPIPEGENRYVNQLWEDQENPFAGDVVNAYNDGPLEDGSQLGPFYEIESSSPAAFLKPGESIRYEHDVFHFVGDEDQLDIIAKAVLGVSIEEIISAFN